MDKLSMPLVVFLHSGLTRTPVREYYRTFVLSSGRSSVRTGRPYGTIHRLKDLFILAVADKAAVLSSREVC